jgi:hypothetical protein
MREISTHSYPSPNMQNVTHALLQQSKLGTVDRSTSESSRGDVMGNAMACIKKLVMATRHKASVERILVGLNSKKLLE